MSEVLRERLDRWAEGLHQYPSEDIPIWRHEVLEFVDTIFEASAMTLGACEELIRQGRIEYRHHKIVIL